MITVTDLELRAGSRILLTAPILRVQPGDRIGLVGRNGAGKTTTLRVLAGEALPYGGKIDRRGEVGYLPQDPRTGDLDVTARDRVLSARGLDTLLHQIEKAQVELSAAVDDTARDVAVRRYGRLEDRFAALGGYAAESRGGPDLRQPRAARPGAGADAAAPCPAASGAGSSWPGSCSATRRTLLLDEPTNHLDADSIGWLRDFLRGHTGRADRDQPRRRPARRRGEQGLVPGRQPGRGGRLQPGLEEVPGTAGDRRAAAAPGAGQRGEEGRRAVRPGRQDAGQGDQGGGRAEHGPAGREAAVRAGGRAQGRPGGQGPVPDPGPVRAAPR